MRVRQDRDSCSKNDPDFSPITSTPAVEELRTTFMILERVMWKGNKTSVFSISLATCRGFRFMPRIELQDLHSECDVRSILKGDFASPMFR